MLGRQRLVVVGAVEPGRGVEGGADALERPGDAGRRRGLKARVTLEHQVLEQVRGAGVADHLVARADVVDDARGRPPAPPGPAAAARAARCSAGAAPRPGAATIFSRQSLTALEGVHSSALHGARNRYHTRHDRPPLRHRDPPHPGDAPRHGRGRGRRRRLRRGPHRPPPRGAGRRAARPQAAIFVPTGTMGNQIAVHLHTQPGSEVILEARGHIFNFEMGAMAALVRRPAAPDRDRRRAARPGAGRGRDQPQGLLPHADRGCCASRTPTTCGPACRWTPARTRALAAVAHRHGLARAPRRRPHLQRRGRPRHTRRGARAATATP